MYPGSGRRLRIRQRKTWRLSCGEGALKLVITTPSGLKLRITWVTVPSLPAVSMPWRTTRSDRLCSAYRRSWSSKSTSCPLSMSRCAFFLPPFIPGVESGSTLAIRNCPSTSFARSRSRISFFATRAKSRRSGLLQLDRYHVESDEAVAAHDRHGDLGADLRLDHQPLQVAGLAHAHVADGDDDVAAAQLAVGGGAAGHDLVHLDAGL